MKIRLEESTIKKGRYEAIFLASMSIEGFDSDMIRTEDSFVTLDTFYRTTSTQISEFDEIEDTTHDYDGISIPCCDVYSSYAFVTFDAKTEEEAVDIANSLEYETLEANIHGEITKKNGFVTIDNMTLVNLEDTRTGNIIIDNG